MSAQRYELRGSSVRRALLALAGVALVAVAACADDASEAEPTPTDDGGVLPPSEAGPVDDAGVDGDAADAAQPPRTCSDQGWCGTLVPAGQTLRGVWSDGAGMTWAVSEQGAILRLGPGENAWTVHATVAGELRAVWGSGPSDVWVGGEKGLYRGQGATPASLVFKPNPVPGDATIAITSLWGSGPNDVWAVGGKMKDESTAGSRVLRFSGASTDAGATWTLDPVSTRPFAFTKVWGTAKSGVWIGGFNSSPNGADAAVFRRAAGTTTFTRITNLPFDPRDGTESGVFGDFTTGGASGNDVWIAGKSRGFSPGFWRGTSTDGVTFTWTHLARDLNDQPLEAIWGTSTTDAWAAGEYGRLRHWNGTAWAQAALMTGKYPIVEPLYAIWGTSTTDVWVVGKGTAIHLDPTKAKK